MPLLKRCGSSGILSACSASATCILQCDRNLAGEAFGPLVPGQSSAPINSWLATEPTNNDRVPAFEKISEHRPTSEPLRKSSLITTLRVVIANDRLSRLGSGGARWVN